MIARDGMQKKVLKKEGPDTEAVAAFKKEFLDGFNDFILSLNVLVDGRATLGDNLADHIGREGIGISMVVITGVLALLAALGILGAALVEAITIPISVAGLIGMYVFTEMRGRKKQNQIKRTEKMLDRDAIDAELESMANLMAYLHQERLANMNADGAKRLGYKVYQQVSNKMLHSDSLKFEDYMDLRKVKEIFPKFAKQAVSKPLKLSTANMVEHLRYSPVSDDRKSFAEFRRSSPAVDRWKKKRTVMQSVKSFFKSIASFFGWKRHASEVKEFELQEAKKPGMFG